MEIFRFPRFSQDFGSELQQIIIGNDAWITVVLIEGYLEMFKHDF